MTIEANSAPGAGKRRYVALFGNAYILLALAGLLWSGNHVAGRAVAGHIPPLFLSALRWLIGAAVIYPFARPHLARDWPAIVRGWKSGRCSARCNMSGCNGRRRSTSRCSTRSRL